MSRVGLHFRNPSFALTRFLTRLGRHRSSSSIVPRCIPNRATQPRFEADTRLQRVPDGPKQFGGLLLGRFGAQPWGFACGSPETSSPLEVLNYALVGFGRLSGRESAEVASPSGFGVLLSRVQAILSRLQFSNHRNPPRPAWMQARRMVFRPIHTVRRLDEL